MSIHGADCKLAFSLAVYIYTRYCEAILLADSEVETVILAWNVWLGEPNIVITNPGPQFECIVSLDSFSRLKPHLFGRHNNWLPGQSQNLYSLKLIRGEGLLRKIARNIVAD